MPQKEADGDNDERLNRYLECLNIWVSYSFVSKWVGWAVSVFISSCILVARGNGNIII